jgi:hypothetical protein
VGFEQMLRRRQINADREGRSVRFLLGLADIVRWPFERTAWTIERVVLWPLRERLAGRGSAGRGAGAVALGAVAVVGVVASILSLTSGATDRRDQVAAGARVAAAAPAAQPQSEAPQAQVLHGASPKFDVGKGVGVSPTGHDEASASGAEVPIAKAEAGGEAAPIEEGVATTSSAKPVPAGPAAMRVARRFSEAFVFYEIGERPARAKTVFARTATPRLARTLAKRPPRLPAKTKVPKARVVNLVPGPRHGKAYTVSVSLLRVGLTSELRLTLEPGKEGDWRVAEILG